MGRLAHAYACRLYFHFWVAVCFFRTSTCVKRFTWKWLDFHANERTCDIYFHTNTFARRFVLLQRQKVNLGLGYSSMSCSESLWLSKLIAVKWARVLDCVAFIWTEKQSQISLQNKAVSKIEDLSGLCYKLLQLTKENKHGPPLFHLLKNEKVFAAVVSTLS